GSIAYRQDVSELAPRSAGDLGQVRAGVSLLTDLPGAAANAFAAVVPPLLVPNGLALSSREAPDPEARPRLFFSFSYRAPALRGLGAGAWTVTWLVLLALGSFGLWRSGPAAGGVLFVSLTALVFHVFLHQRFHSRDMYLYVLHWHAPMLFMLAGLG